MKPQQLRDSLPQELRGLVEFVFKERGVRDSITLAGLAACGYLTNPELCPAGEAYAHEIADGVFGRPTLGGDSTRPEMQIAINILEQGKILKKQPNETYRVANYFSAKRLTISRISP